MWWITDIILIMIIGVLVWVITGLITKCVELKSDIDTSRQWSNQARSKIDKLKAKISKYQINANKHSQRPKKPKGPEINKFGV